MSSLPTPPTEDSSKSPVRRSSKVSSSAKPTRQIPKRSSTSHDHGATINKRYKRVWKACGRCRMKKIKCDGEFPCKRCKDVGLVCMAGSRKNTEFKQLPRGYAELLENTQYALIATAQKLYKMIRNGESWDLGEPELTDTAQPVIHDIALKLGCIRPSPDMLCAISEGAEDAAELQAQLQVERTEIGTHNTGNRKSLDDSAISSPALDYTSQASSIESDHSALSKNYMPMLWQQQQQAVAISKTNLAPINTAPSKLQPQATALGVPVNDEISYQPSTSFESIQSIPLPILTNFQSTSPLYCHASPFSPWSRGDEFLGQAHGQDFTNYSTRQQQYHNAPILAPLRGVFPGQMQMNNGMNFGDRTIRPGILDCGNSIDFADQVNNVMFVNDFENSIEMA